MERRVIVVDYDPAWPGAFEGLRGRIGPVVGAGAVGIEHVGSTAVPGLAAKPIIDLTIVVPAAGGGKAMGRVIERLATIGYRHRGDLGVPGREAFARPAGTRRDHHLYACVAGSLPLRNHLFVRDHLRAHPAVAQAYGELKKRLAARFPHDIDAYIAGKTDFILAILNGAGFSAEQLAAIRTINTVPKA